MAHVSILMEYGSPVGQMEKKIFDVLDSTLHEGNWILSGMWRMLTCKDKKKTPDFEVKKKNT